MPNLTTKSFRKLLKRNIQETKSEASQSTHLLKKIWKIKLIKGLVTFVVAIILAPIIIFIAFAPKVQDPIYYGITFSHKYVQGLKMDWKEVYIKILDDLGVKNLRLVAYWDEIEPEPGKFNYENIKWQLEEARKRDINVILTIGRKVPRFPECFEPEWWKAIPDESTRDQALFNYLGKSVQELKGYTVIKRWQVENEPFFPFGTCLPIKYETVKKETEFVRRLDPRPILVQDSGEGGFWLPSYLLGDNLGISMYRKIFYDFWGVLLGKSVYFQYPLAHWTYHVKAKMLGIDPNKVIVTELQGEPWGPGFVSDMSNAEKDKSMSLPKFIDTLNYAQRAGFKEYYFWGAEWWLWEKEKNNRPYFWDTAKAIFKSGTY